MLDQLIQRRLRRRPYYEAAVAVTTRLVAAATHLKALFAAPEEQLDSRAAAIAAILPEVDGVVHDVRARLDRAFITPIDREHILDLATELRRVAHLIGDVARLAVTYRIDEVRAPAVALADTLVRACERLQTTIGHVRAVTLALDAHASVRHVEKEADAIYTQAIGTLFAGDLPVIETLKWKDLYDGLEDAVDGCAHAAGAIAHASVAQS